MAQTLYSGLQGHGKSYEVVRSVIVEAVASGRRVVTNIAGLQPDKIKSYVLKNNPSLTSDQLGEIVSVQNEDVTNPNFFPVENVDNSDKVVQGGDIIVLDECWRWYVSGEKLPAGHLSFFRMHRHFLHPVTGQCCDIVLIVQSIDDLQRSIRGTIEKSYLMKKHKDLGTDKYYSVTVYSGKKQIERAVIQQFQQQYKPEIFELYTSYSQSTLEKGVEKQADKRGNIFSRPIVKYGLPLSFLAIGSAFYGVWGFFHPKNLKPVENSVSVGSTASASSASSQPDKTTNSSVSSSWRLAGTFSNGSNVIFILTDSNGRVRHVINPPGFKAMPGEIELALPDGEIVTYWSGPASDSKKIGVSL